MNLIEELRWRGMIHDMIPGTDEQLAKEITTAYVGIDPTADSLHIGHLVSIMLLKHLQLAGHKPIVLVGVATGMIGDPSGKKDERKLLKIEDLQHNEVCIKKQLEKFLDFDCGQNSAELVNNYDWFQHINAISFLREAGKFLTVNYLLGKTFIKERLSKDDISFTEFNYILMQAYDFLWLFENKNCKLQMGGSDQWGNITAGTELIRKKLHKETFGLTCPLITKADGGKFGKTEKGNVWLDARYTSPYQFYQFWMNVSDEDAEKYIKIFTLLSHNEIEKLIKQHKTEPHLRLLQSTLAKEITVMVHSKQDYQKAVDASQILFGKGTKEMLKKMNETLFLSVFEGVPQFIVDKKDIVQGIILTELLAVKTQIFPSKGEARKMIQAGGLSINKEKVIGDITVNSLNLLNNKFLLVQKGKKNYYLVIIV
ncbi:MAG: tyrosine--tRNA ligase [Bacteroidetes bacterium CG23_combo_of_CG06-09_8_20_14_all_32_9]|nr:MAG: tyrosine--tRNA ligase [Bacteroidetes bacterium CG23_combo_of_CG06-09_8_20_14_all_32_9]